MSIGKMKFLTRVIAVSVSTFLFLTSPRFQSYQAFAQSFAAQGAVARPVTNVSVPVGVPGAAVPGGIALSGIASPQHVGLGSALPTLPGLAPRISSPDAVRPPARSAAVPGALGKGVGAVVQPVAPVFPATRLRNDLRDRKQRGQDGKSKGIAAIAKGVRAALSNAGPIQETSPARAHSLGGRLNTLLGGGMTRSRTGSTPVPTTGRFGAMGSNFSKSDGSFSGKPAGSESIVDAVEAHNRGKKTPAPAPAKKPGDNKSRTLMSGLVGKIPVMIIGVAGLGLALAEPVTAAGIAVVLSLLVLPDLILPKSSGRRLDLRNKLAGFAGGALLGVLGRHYLVAAAVSPWYAYALAIGLPAALALMAHRLEYFRRLADEAFEAALRERFAQGRKLMDEVYEVTRWMAYDGRMKVESPYMEVIKWNQPYDFINRVMKDSARPTPQEASELRRMLEPLLEFYKSRLVERYPDWDWDKKREYKAKADEIVDVLSVFERQERSSSRSVKGRNLAVADNEPGDRDEGPRQSPFVPKLISAGLATLPAVLLGWPLLAGGSVFAGIGVIATSLGMVALPFMNERTSKFVRTIPGYLILVLGGYTLITGIAAGSGIVMGALVTLGGWGLMRYGRSDDMDSYYDSEKVLTAFFGGLGAVAGAGLILAGPGLLLSAVSPVWLVWTVKGATWLAYPLTGLLLMHLPSWVGEGIGAAFSGIWRSGQGVHRVLGSLKRDTVLRERLSRFTERWLERSPWNAIWLGGIWIPVWISDALMFLTSAAAGIVFGAAQAPMMFLWGAAYKLAHESKFNKFFGSWNHFVFNNAQGSKIKVYNRFVTPLARLANSKSKLKSWPAGAAIRVLQLVWLVYALAAFVPLAVFGFFRAFTKMGEPYDRAKHRPGSMRASRDDRPDVDRPDEPDNPDQPAKQSFIPRLIASGIALIPLYFLGLPMLEGVAAGVIYLATGLALAAMPFMPSSTPKAIRQAPGYLLIGLGVFTSFVVPWLLFGMVGPAGIPFLLKTNMFWMGVVTALSGWGLVRYTGKGGPAKDRWYSVDDPEYIGAFFGALGVLTGMGVALLGLTGWVPLIFKVGGYLTSLLLLMHLPKWVGEGVRTVFDGIWGSMKNYTRVLGFWHRDAKFYDNLEKHARYWLDKSVWNGAWLSVIWVPTWAMMLAEWVLSGVLGLAAGLVKAPFNFLWGALYKVSPDSRLTRLVAGFARGLSRWSDGSKKTVFDRLFKPFRKAIDERTEESGRPTLKAAGAFLAGRVIQALWLAAVGLPLILTAALPLAMIQFPWVQGILALAMMQTSIILVAAFFEAVINATGKKEPPKEDEDGWIPPDEDDPGDYY